MRLLELRERWNKEGEKGSEEERRGKEKKEG